MYIGCNKYFYPFGGFIGITRKSVTILAVGVLTAVLVGGCGVSPKKVTEAKKRIETVRSSGIADSLLSSAEVYLQQTEILSNIGNSAGAGRNFDSALTCITQAEALYSKGQTTVKPWIDSVKTAITTSKQTLTGGQLKVTDSMLALVDAALSNNNIEDAKKNITELNTLMPALIADEQKSVAIKPKLIGTWTGSSKIEGEEAKGIDKKQFTFSKDGKVEVIEERQGQTNQVFKEDWKFISSGTYELKGDTILIFVAKEKCPKQIYQDLKEVNGKKSWVKTAKPTYDSTITNHSKDRFVTFDYISTELKRKK